MTTGLVIETKYVCPTNFKGARVSGKSYRCRVIVPWDDGSSEIVNHARAAQAVLKKMELGFEQFVYGESVGGGRVFIVKTNSRHDRPSEALPIDVLS